MVAAGALAVLMPTVNRCAMDRALYNQVGSVDDTRCSLSFINPKSKEDALGVVVRINESIENEKQNQNRITVIKMLESKKAWVNRLIDTKLNTV